MKFFKSKKEKTLDEAYGNLEQSVKSIDTNIDRYNKELNIIKQKIEEEKKKVPVNQHVINNLRNKAAVIIKRKKTYENNKENTLGIQFNIDQIKYANENIQMSIDTCKALEQSSKVLKKNIKKVNINKIEKLQDDLYDCMEDAKEIGEILSSTYDIPINLDEDEIDAELSLIEDNILDENVEENITSYLENNDEEIPQEKTITENDTERLKNNTNLTEQYCTQKEG
ncbi:vacuolar protein sorting-associated protein 60, putative [Plasmodium chabaudi chabaudi]|uniref:Vacuolar protein sorting-associated protein 60, putative n=2 Tax=Plasmodium chabaudi TaxID=5825 RepID=A0A077TT05_PLACU|nr:vacuolar protein sorting-associated protein 60, putative [Plasmodium chabaudi chabaudi]SCM03777.1 vacuolar-sorting protein SNF7, putative [Plasmodium chabaudi chabaudi]SCM11831.1 vacuolar-sorting protein SNF7, putative [Plasmodium chabaudi adami]VTZ70039.1 vacuolar protein sorting-associated protein 60, putative [Plasmodium chabaudi chabaudi]|eukprot:XP_016654446.1 vacuolar-sorting protein SNF7, putative [Plasmodium chabaudi chabaudi]